MTGSGWAAAVAICLHMSALGGLPREVRVPDVKPYATGQQHLRVLIADGAEAVRVRPRAAVTITDAAGAALGRVAAGATITLRPTGGAVALSAPGLRATRPGFAVRPVRGDAAAAVAVDGGWGRAGTYSARLDIAPGSRGLQVVERAALEDYIAGVVAAEMPASFPLEAQKAQAVAARTYALYHLGAHEPSGADICGTVHCQAYGGRPAGQSRAAQAAAITSGYALTWNGLLIDAMYHASCGGSTATAWEVRQGKLLPYLRGQPDRGADGWGEPYCAQGREVRWGRRVSFDEADRFVRQNLGTVLREPGLEVGRLEGIDLVKDPRTGRARWLEVRTSGGVHRVRGDAVRWIFGTGRPGPAGLRSAAFDMETERDASGRPQAFTFSGAGHGHGIGLCQWGARGRALAGATTREILAAYYPGAAVVDLRQ